MWAIFLKKESREKKPWSRVKGRDRRRIIPSDKGRGEDSSRERFIPSRQKPKKGKRRGKGPGFHAQRSEGGEGIGRRTSCS